MMIKSFIAAVMLLIATNGMAQITYDTSRDANNGSLIYKGAINFELLYTEGEFEWMRSGAEKYEPKAKFINILKQELPHYKLLIFMGTWCGDSKDRIPELFKVLQQANYPLNKVDMYGMDRNKSTGMDKEKNYNITRVPTIIVLDGDKEVGRITESLQKSMEADLARIVK